MKKALLRIYEAVCRLKKLVDHPEKQTYYPDADRKGRFQIFIENLMWLLKHREINHFYYLYGFDRKDFNRPDDYFPEQAFCRLRDSVNACRQVGDHRARYICMLQDKFIFGQYLSVLGFPTPPILALADSEGILWMGDEQKRESWADLVSHENLDGFLKDTLGRCGRSVYPIRVEGGKVFVSNEEISPEELRKQISGKYIIQQRVYQHPEIDRVYPLAVNTLRLITLCKGDEIVLASATFRMGAGGNRFDNWAGGGIGVGANTETGQLDVEGTFRLGFGGRVKAHPDSGVVFRTYDVPYFQEAAELVKRLHSFFYGIHSIGWDVAIGPDGPTVIEGNNSWDVAFQQFHDDKIKHKFLDSLKV